MPKRSLWRATVAACIGIVIAVAASRWPMLAQEAPPNRPFEATPFQEGACLAFGATEAARNSATGAMRFIGTPAGFPLPHPLGHDARTPPETAARGFLTACGSLFGLTGDASELSLESTSTTDDQRSVVRFQQMYRGTPVFGGEIIVNLDRNRNVMATSGKLSPRVRVATAPSITGPEAAGAAVRAMAREHGVDARDLSAAPPQLWVYDATLIGPDRSVPRLVWRTEVTASDLQPIRELVLIDAVRGNVALHFNQIDTALQRQTYTANNTNTLPGTLVCDESNPTCAGGDEHAVSAHLSAGDTYNFYLANHGRDGINGTGGVIRSTVHYSSGYFNAFWNGVQMVYGDGAGFALADDVVGHELTHGVTQYTSNLFYYYQSGAINESLSDVFGEFVDQTNGRGNDASSVRWQLGEDIAGFGAIRSMSDPTLFGDPDRMTSPYYYLYQSDSGGVHFNSGINNKAAFLMVDGGTFNGQTIAGLGIAKTAKIYYEVQTHLLTSAADYGDLYYALFQACNNLVGTSDIYSDDCQEVRKATLAVEMNLQPVPGFNAETEICPIGQTPSHLFFDNLENGAGNFSTITSVGTNRWRYDSPWGVFAHSGQHFLYADDFPAAPTDTSVAMTNGVTLPANAFLHFAHAYGFENPNYDGGVVEYSTNGGGSWIDAGPLFYGNTGTGYNGTVATGWQNPLAGRTAYVGDSHGYISSRLSLSSLAGQTVKFRWRMGLDSVGYNWGWWLDDIRIYTCDFVQPPAVAGSPSPADGATGVSTNAKLTWSAAGATSYDVAFGTVNPPPTVVTGLPAASYTPKLATNTTYYWRVTSRNTSGGNPGPVWSFTTAASPTGLLVLDTFSGGPQSLTSHTPDVNIAGGSWTVTGGTGNPTVDGGVVGVTAGSGHVQATLQTGTPDIRVGVDYLVGSGQQSAALVFRYTDVDNHLLLMFLQNALHVYRRQAGTYTLLASSAPLAPIVSGSVHRLEVRAVGSGITGWWNGVQVVQAVDLVQQSATRHGVDWNSAYDPTTTFDNLEIRDTASPPSTPTNPSPLNETRDVSTSARLTWSAVGATSYDVAFGTANPPPPVATGLTANYTPLLTANTTYYWRVTARNPIGTTTGPVWTFTTGSRDDLLVLDTFTGGCGEPLTSHVPDVNVVGGAWTVTGDNAPMAWVCDSVGVTGGTGHIQATVETGAPDIRMGVDYWRLDYNHVGNAPRLAALVFRYTDVNNHLLLMFYQNALHFYRRQSGSYVLLASSSPLMPPLNDFMVQRMEVRTSGTQLTGWWNGVQVVQATDTVQRNATRHGVDWNGAYDPTPRFDNLEIRNIGAPLTPPSAPTTPSPTNGATSVAMGTSLTWNAAGATSYDVAFGTTNPPAPEASDLSTPSYTPTLAESSTYYWQVIAKNAIGSAAGPVWSFTTAAIPPDLLVSDAFNGTGLLSAHTPDVNRAGGPWLVTGGTPIPTLGGGMVGVTAGSGHVQSTLDTGAPDIRMSVDYRVGASSQQLAALAFRLTDANNHLLLMFYQNALHFYRRQAGAYTLLASSAQLAPIASGTTQRIEVRTSGTQLTGWWNNAQVVSATDSVQQTAMLHGIDWNSAFDPTARFDNLEIRNNGAPLVPPSAPGSPSPVNDAADVAPNASLTWTASGATSYDIAFDTTNPPAPAATGLASASYTPTMTANTTYFWQVIARNAFGSTTGPIWTFTTGSPPVDLLVTDTFTGSGLLTSHVPDVNVAGGPWMYSGGTPAPTVGGGVVGVMAGGGHLQGTLDTGTPDVRMGVDYVVGASPQRLAALVFRFTNPCNHFLLMFYENALHIYRAEVCQYTLVSSSPLLAPVAAGSRQRVEVRTAGSQITGWWNGVQVVQATSTFNQTATEHGLHWNSAFDSSTTFDNLEIRNLGAPLTPPSVPSTPSPANGATGVTTTPTLTWSAPGATTYDVAFGTVNPPPPRQTGSPVPVFIPAALAANTTYYWQITAQNVVGSTTGPVWSFTTGALPVDLLVSDTFTGPPGVSLTTHAPEINLGGQPWSVTGGTANLQAGEAVVATSGSGHVQATLQTGAPDVRVSADYRVGLLSQQLAALAFRFTDANNHLLLMFYQNALHFYRRQGGAYTLLGSSPPLASIAGGSTQRIEVRALGTQLTGWWNGVQVVQATDAVQQMATRHGLDWNFAYDPAAMFDNLEIRNIGAPLVPPSPPTGPSPGNAATGVSTAASLTWSAAGATSYDVAFGTMNPPPPVAIGLTSASYTPTMSANTTYYWQVTARNASGSAIGPVWTFTTGSTSVPILLVSDTFTGSGSTLLTSHTPDVNVPGGPWVVTGGPPIPIVSGGVVDLTNSGAGHLQATLQTNVADIRMSADYNAWEPSSQRLAALAFRLTDANNHLLLMFYEDALHLYRRQAGTYTLLASSSPLSLASLSTHRMEVRTSGSQLTGWWDGVQVVQATDSFQQSATRHGLDWNSAFDTLASFDNLEIRGISLPAGPDVPASPNPSDGTISPVFSFTTVGP